MADQTEPSKNLKWIKHPLREVLKKDIVDGKITPEMKPSEAAKIRPEWEKMEKKLFASRLSAMRKVIANKKPPKSPRWDKKNPARHQLKWDIADGIIPADMTDEDAKQVRSLYEYMNNDKFKSRLKSMRKAVDDAKERAEKDAAALLHDRLIYPRPTHNHRGEPQWADHEASTLLELDVSNGAHEGKSPYELWMTRLQYQEFLLETFRGHLYQEGQTQKWRQQWVDGKKHYAIVPEPYWAQGEQEEKEEQEEK